jgi:hypothetical protein
MKKTHICALTDPPSPVAVEFVSKQPKLLAEALDSGVSSSLAFSSEVGEVRLSYLEQVVGIGVLEVDGVFLHERSQLCVFVVGPARHCEFMIR